MVEGGEEDGGGELPRQAVRQLLAMESGLARASLKITIREAGGVEIVFSNLKMYGLSQDFR